MAVGVAAWGALVGAISAYETWAILTSNHTLSAIVWKLNESSGGKIITGSVWAVLSFHLFVEPILRKRTGSSEQANDVYTECRIQTREHGSVYSPKG